MTAPRDNPPGPTASQLRARVLGELERLGEIAPSSYRVMGRSGPIGQGLTLAEAEALAGVSGCTIEAEGPIE